jgi:DNA-binding NtrC family response regulator
MTAARVLIVDDDPMALEALQQMLELRVPTMQVETCASAADALERVSSQAFDAVLADLAMPDMDGLRLLACIRKRQPLIPTLLMTGHGDPALAERALREGAVAFFEKPLNRDYLVQALNSAIQRGRPPEEPGE